MMRDLLVAVVAAIIAVAYAPSFWPGVGIYLSVCFLYAFVLTVAKMLWHQFRDPTEAEMDADRRENARIAGQR